MNKTNEFLDFIIDQHERTSRHLHQKDLNSIQFFCIGLLERQANAAKALRVLIKEIHQNPALEYSCGIILRSVLLDTLLALKLYSLVLENDAGNKTDAEKEAVIKGYCDTILSDGLENTLTYIKAAKDVGIITGQQHTDTMNNFAKKYERFFKPHPQDGSKPQLKITTFFSPAQLFKQIAANPKLKQLAKLYDSYLYFSKYDHFGIMYYEVARQPYYEQWGRIKRGIELFVGTNSILHTVLRMYSGNDPFLIKQSNEAAKYLMDEILDPQPNKSAGIGTIY